MRPAYIDVQQVGRWSWRWTAHYALTEYGQIGNARRGTCTTLKRAVRKAARCIEEHERDAAHQRAVRQLGEELKRRAAQIAA